MSTNKKSFFWYNYENCPEESHARLTAEMSVRTLVRLYGELYDNFNRVTNILTNDQKKLVEGAISLSKTRFKAIHEDSCLGKDIKKCLEHIEYVDSKQLYEKKTEDICFCEKTYDSESTGNIDDLPF